MEVVVRRERKKKKKQWMKLAFCDKCQRGTGGGEKGERGAVKGYVLPSSCQLGPVPAGPLSAKGDAKAGTMLTLHSM